MRLREVSSATSIFGMIVSSWSSAKVIAGDTYASEGGLAGSNGGTILNSYATGEVSGCSESSAGGLVGDNGSSIVGCFATGRVHGGSSSGGGLVGYNAYIIKNSYAEGDVSDAGIDGTNSLGGLVGFDQYGASLSYSTGKASGGMLDSLGGAIGVVDYGARYHDVYWDTTSRGVSQGAGNLHDKQLEALTSNELRSGLPTGFAKSVWKQKPGINRDFPYLIPNQPPK